MEKDEEENSMIEEEEVAVTEMTDLVISEKVLKISPENQTEEMKEEVVTDKVVTEEESPKTTMLEEAIKEKIISQEILTVN